MLGRESGSQTCREWSGDGDGRCWLWDNGLGGVGVSDGHGSLELGLRFCEA